jgi:hypothetical protein
VFNAYGDIGCVVVAGPAVRFFEQNLNIPVILFSWVDPTYTPAIVKHIFDDSHWILASRALRSMPPPGEEMQITSSQMLFRDRLDARNYRLLRKLIKERVPKN